MKKRFCFFIVGILCFTFSGYSQDSFTVNGLSEGKQWQIIEKAMYDNGYEIGKFIPADKVIYSNWITWNSLTIQNRGLVEIKLLGDKATISMIQRSYKTKDGWANAIGKLSKKNKKKYLLSLSTKISEIIASEKFTADAVQNSKLFPAFKPVNTVLGVEFTLNSMSQDIESENKELTLTYTVKNVSAQSVKIEVNLWGAKNIFLRIPGTMENFVPGKRVGGERFHNELKPNEIATFSAHYRCTEIITKIPKYTQLIHANGKRKELVIHDIKLPYNNKNIVVPNNLNNTNQTGNLEQKTPQGIYDNFALVKTGNPEMQLMAIHEDGSMIGFQLDKNHQRVLSVTFRKDLYSPNFVLFFDDDGHPKGGGFGDYVYVFQNIEGDNYKAITFDKEGNNINETEIQLEPSPKVNQFVDPNNNKGGPNLGSIPYSISIDKGFLEWLQEQSRILNYVGCAVSIPSGLGAIGPCGVLLIDEILRVLPKEHAYYDELVLAKEFLSFATFATPKGFLDKVTTITGAMVTSVATIKGFAEKHFPETPDRIKPLKAITDKEYKKVDCVDVQTISGVMYIPIIVDHKEKMIYNDGRKTERDNPKKEITIQVNINTKDMCFSNSVFTGVIKKNIGIAMDEVITYKGKVSKDNKKLEYIEITKESTQYLTGERKEVEKTISISVKFVNIPIDSWVGYEYKYGVSRIASVSYNEKYRIPRYGYINSYTEEFVKINEEKITEHYKGVRVGFN